MKKKIYKIIYLITITIVLSIYFTSFVKADDEDEEEINEEYMQEISLETAGNINEEPKLNARAAIIYNRTTNEVMWGKNENDKKAMASTTKIMTAIVILEKANLSDVVTISKKAAGTGGSRLKISEGDKVTINDLLYGLMLRSGNDAAVALAEHVGGSIEGFAELMNNKAKEIGLVNTHFVTPHGLDDENHYTTAYELAILTDYALKNETFAKIVNTKNTTININGVNRSIYNTNELLGYKEGVNGVKTGFTNNAGRCLVTSCTRNQNQIITVVLGCDTKKQRTLDSSKLIEYAFNNYKIIDLEEKIQKEFENWKQINLNRIYIDKANTSEIEVKLGNIQKNETVIKNEEEADINIEINAIYNYKAPIKKETKIGNIIIKNKDKVIETIDILCSKEIERKSVKDYLIQMIQIIPNYNFIK